MNSLLVKFLMRWFVSSLGLWIAAAILGPEKLSVGNSWVTLVGAGFLLAVVNMILKPILVILSIPVLLLTLGIFMLVINGFLILLASWIYDPLFVKNLWVAIIAGMIVGFVNFLVSHIVKDLVDENDK